MEIEEAREWVRSVAAPKRPALRVYTQKLGWHWLLLDYVGEQIGTLQEHPDASPPRGTWEILRHIADRSELVEALEQIRDREYMEPSEYIAAYGEPSMTPGQLASDALDKVPRSA